MRRSYRTILVLVLLTVVLLAEVSDRGGVEAGGNKSKTGGDRRRKTERDRAKEEGNAEGGSHSLFGFYLPITN